MMRANRKGFTIIELLVVVAIMGLLATLALPKLTATRQRATVATMITDLKNMLTAQEGFFVNYRDYAGGIAASEVPGPGAAGRVVSRLSPGNQVVVTRQNGSGGVGWSATMTNPSVTDPTRDTCGIFVGAVSYSPNAAVTTPGTVACY
jgi:prepilin-type N-terminal cleavage/methylation domain-containing protein